MLVLHRNNARDIGIGLGCVVAAGVLIKLLSLVGIFGWIGLLVYFAVPIGLAAWAAIVLVQRYWGNHIQSRRVSVPR